MAKGGKWFLLTGLGCLVFSYGLVGLGFKYGWDTKGIGTGSYLVILLLGAVTAVWSFAQGMQGLLDALLPFSPVNLREFLKKDVVRRRGPRLVVIGGGTGLSVLLKGLKEYSNNITAIVTVTDDGGSSGRLRGELGVLPPGDIRNCLVALAETETLMDEVFQHRFNQGSVKGHNLGNLLITALAEITGDLRGAIKEVSKVLAVRGQVLPATLEMVALGAVMEDGQVIIGETAITQAKKSISRVFLIPSDCRPLPEAKEAIRCADAVVMGPGSLYTSIIPNLLVSEIKEALGQTKGVRIFVVNIMTQPGETDGYTASEHVKAVIRHVGEGIIDYALINNAPLDQERLERYLKDGAEPVVADEGEILRCGVRPVSAPLLGSSEVAWHDPQALAREILKLVYSRKGLEPLG